MRRYLFSALLILPLLFITGCGESVYSGASDTSTNEAIIDALDFSFIGGQCQSIIDYYDVQVSSGASINDDDMYKYLSAILSCSGFDVLSGVNSVLTNGGSDIYMTAGALMGITFVDVNKSVQLQSYYDKAISLCYSKKAELEKLGQTLNDTNKTICGFAGMMGAVVNMSALMLNTSGGGASIIELSETGFQYFADNEIDETIGGQSLASYLKEKDDFLMQLNNGLTIGEDGAQLIGSVIGQNDFSTVLSELAGLLRDKEGNITEDSLINYITTTLGIPIKLPSFSDGSVPTIPGISGDIPTVTPTPTTPPAP